MIIDPKKLKFKTFLGEEVITVVEEVSKFRILHFKEFPYLYVGTMDYEAKYFEKFTKNSKSYIEVIYYDGKVLGVCTGTPLKSDTDILKEAEALFDMNGLCSDEYFYVGEVIIDETLRGQGLASKLLNNAENYAGTINLKKLTLTTVVRSSKDKRMPQNYKNINSVWLKNGYLKSGLNFSYNWPSLNESQVVVDMDHIMEFWTKTK